MKKDNSWDMFFKNSSGNNYPNEIIVRFVMNYYKVLKNKDRKKIKILDLGSGSGANFFFLLENNFSVSALDISRNALNKLKLKIKHKKIKVEKKNIKLGSFNKIPFNNDQFDMVIDSTSLQHCKKKLMTKSILEISRVLKKKGCFFSIYQNNNFNKKFYYNRLSLIDLKKILKKNFKNISTGYINLKLPIIDYIEHFNLIKSIKK